MGQLSPILILSASRGYFIGRSVPKLYPDAVLIARRLLQGLTFAAYGTESDAAFRSAYSSRRPCHDYRGRPGGPHGRLHARQEDVTLALRSSKATPPSEASPRTVQYNGYRFDLGGHRFFTKITPVQQLWHEILGTEFIQVPTAVAHPLQRQVLRLSTEADERGHGAWGCWNAALIVASYLKWHYRPYLVEENLEQWVTNRFGRRLYLAFFKTYTEKVWGDTLHGDPRRVGRATDSGALARSRHPQRDLAQQAVDRHQVADSYHSITRALGRAKCGRPVAT